MAEPRVAVIVPCYNNAATLAETLESVRGQTVPLEVVVVDDGSEDESAAVADRAGVRCIRQANAGPGAARNRGVRETGARWLAFLDADDRFATDKLARQLQHADETGAVLSCCDARLLCDGELGARKHAGQEIPAEISYAGLLLDNPIICSSVLLRRAAFEQAGGFDEDRALIATEDYDLWLRIARVGAVRYLDAPLVHYRVWSGSLSDDERFVHGLDRIMEKVAAAGGGPKDLPARIARRRAAVRVASAYHLARRGEGARARARLAEARALTGASWPAFKIWLRSWWR